MFCKRGFSGVDARFGAMDVKTCSKIYYFEFGGRGEAKIDTSNENSRSIYCTRTYGLCETMKETFDVRGGIL